MHHILSKALFKIIALQARPTSTRMQEVTNSESNRMYTIGQYSQMHYMTNVSHFKDRSGQESWEL